jgi:hypothetical protein
VTDAMRRLFVVTAALVTVIAVQLFVLTEQTESYFAWTIAVPLSAAWLGAGYCSGIALLGLAARERLWCRARIVVPAVPALTLAMLVTTFIHLDLFHLEGPLSPATPRGVWMGRLVYLGARVDHASSAAPAASSGAWRESGLAPALVDASRAHSAGRRVTYGSHRSLGHAGAYSFAVALGSDASYRSSHRSMAPGHGSRSRSVELGEPHRSHAHPRDQLSSVCASAANRSCSLPC